MSAFTKELATRLLGAVIDSGRSLPSIEDELGWPRGDLLRRLVDHEHIDAGTIAALVRVLGGERLADALDALRQEQAAQS